MINILKSRVSYVLWKLKMAMVAKKNKGIYDDCNSIYWMDPGRIEQTTDVSALNRLDPEVIPPIAPVRERGKIVDGDWDLKVIPFEQLDAWRAFETVFTRGGKWEETQFYKRVIRTMNGGVSMWGCNTKEEFRERLRYLNELYQNIEQFGYKTQAEINENKLPSLKHEDEIHVHINRYGDYIFADGRHRLCIAKLLNLETIPVKVARRHKLWADFRREILYYKDRHNNQLYAPLTHPDLVDIPSAHAHERFNLILEHIPFIEGKVLDLGTHWGYFCHRFEEIGFDCTGVEKERTNIYFLKKLRRAENRKFNFIEGSLLNLSHNVNNDITLALNIFHHFIKTEKHHKELKEFLKRLNTKIMFFEPHKPSELQMTNSYRNYAPEEFVKVVMKEGGFISFDQIGLANDGRPLYRLRK